MSPLVELAIAVELPVSGTVWGTLDEDSVTVCSDNIVVAVFLIEEVIDFVDDSTIDIVAVEAP